MAILATHHHDTENPQETLEFLKRTRNELRTLRKVHIWEDRFQVFDINGDSFEVIGIGYPHPEVLPLLDQVHAVYNPQTIHQTPPKNPKELKTGKRRPWAEDRVM